MPRFARPGRSRPHPYQPTFSPLTSPPSSPPPSTRTSRPTRTPRQSYKPPPNYCDSSDDEDLDAVISNEGDETRVEDDEDETRVEDDEDETRVEDDDEPSVLLNPSATIPPPDKDQTVAPKDTAADKKPNKSPQNVYQQMYRCDPAQSEKKHRYIAAEFLNIPSFNKIIKYREELRLECTCGKVHLFRGPGRIGSSITIKEQFMRSKRYLEAANKAVNKTEEDVCEPMSDEDLTLLMNKCDRYLYPRTPVPTLMRHRPGRKEELDVMSLHYQNFINGKVFCASAALSKVDISKAPTTKQIAWAVTVVGNGSEYRGPGRHGEDRRNRREQAAQASKKQTDLDERRQKLAAYLTSDVRWATAAWALLMFHLLIRSGDLDSAHQALAYFKLRIPYSNPRLPLTTDFDEIVVYLIAPLDQRRLHVRLQLTGHQQGEHQKDVYSRARTFYFAWPTDDQIKKVKEWLERTRELGKADKLGSTTFIEFRDRFLRKSPLDQLEQPAPTLILGVGPHRRRLLVNEGVPAANIDAALFLHRNIRSAFHSAEATTKDIFLDISRSERRLEISLILIKYVAEHWIDGKTVSINCSFSGYSRSFTLSPVELYTRQLSPANVEAIRSASVDHLYQTAIEKREYGKRTGLGEKKADVRLEMNVAANMVFTFWVLNMAKHRYTASNFYCLMLLTKRGLSRKVGLRVRDLLCTVYDRWIMPCPKKERAAMSIKLWRSVLEMDSRVLDLDMTFAKKVPGFGNFGVSAEDIQSAIDKEDGKPALIKPVRPGRWMYRSVTDDDIDELKKASRRYQKWCQRTYGFSYEEADGVIAFNGTAETSQAAQIIRWSRAAAKSYPATWTENLQPFFEILHSHTHQRASVGTHTKEKIWLDDETFPNMYFCLDQSKSALLPSISRRDHSRGHISGFTSGLKGWSYEKSNIKCDTWFTNALQFTGKPEEMAQRVEFFRTTCEYLWSTKGVSFLAKEEMTAEEEQRLAQAYEMLETYPTYKTVNAQLFDSNDDSDDDDFEDDSEDDSEDDDDGDDGDEGDDDLEEVDADEEAAENRDEDLEEKLGYGDI